MKTSIALTLAALTLAALTLAALMLALAPANASHIKKKTVQAQAATASQQVSIKHVRLRARVLVVNQ